MTSVAEPLTIAAIGLGRMGGPMADHLVAAGHKVRVHDVSASAVAPRVAAGAEAAASPADAARSAHVVDIVVFDDAQAIEVMCGDDGVLTTLGPGAVVCVHTTVSIDTIRLLAARAEPHGVTVLDAGISGGEAGAQAGTLLSLVGGPADALDRARPALDAFSEEVLHAGPLGAGMALKLARNAAGYTMMAAVHEAMVVAERWGVDPQQLRHAIEVTGVLQQALTPFALGGPEPLPADAPDETRRFLDHTRLLGEKDLDQTLALADELGAHLPVTEATRASFAAVMRL